MTLEEELAALRAARAKGARRLKTVDGEVEFHSLKEMDARIARIEAEIAGRARGTFGVSYPVTGRGL